MCVSSVISLYGHNRIPVDEWNRQTLDAYMALLRQADIFDSLTHQPDCVDPKKNEWVARVQEHIRASAVSPGAPRT